jgi:hypothetical protein
MKEAKYARVACPSRQDRPAPLLDEDISGGPSIPWSEAAPARGQTGGTLLKS